MPYYCTVPRCTSMAGKVKNVSFHQFPRDEELAKLWNKVLKRGKPYTKYSKVCSLHFKPEDYTITNAKNKDIPGQWRTLRKDAIPSQNLPCESPVRTGRPRQSEAWTGVPSMMEPHMQTIAQAIYIQTMLALQAGGTTLDLNSISNESQDNTSHSSNPERLHPPHDSSDSDEESKPIELTNKTNLQDRAQILHEKEITSYKCTECLKCFKDPDVLTLHKRAHTKDKTIDKNHAREKENVDRNSGASQETLRANPILANLLKSSLPEHNANTNSFNEKSMIENQIMANMASYVSNLSNLLSNQNGGSGTDNESNSDCDNEDLNMSNSNSLAVDENV